MAQNNRRFETRRNVTSQATRRQALLMPWIVGFLILVNILLIYGIFVSPHGLSGYLQKHRDVNILEGQIERLNASNQHLYKKIQKFKNDKNFQERIVRSELGWVKGDEIVFEFPPAATENKKNLRHP